jgi:hypothetical protein
MALTRLLPRPHTRARSDRGPTLARVIAFANQKGGVAKTTTTLNLGVALAEKGQRVLAIDLDPQGNLTMSQGWNPDEIDRSMFDVLAHKLPITEIIRKGEIDVAVSSIDLAGAELALSSMIGRERALEKALLPVREVYDWIMIDTPPSLGLLTGHLINGENLHVLQNDIGILPVGAAFRTDQYNVDVIAGQDETGNPPHIVDPHRHGALALIQQGRQRTALAGSGDLGAQHRLVALDRRQRHAAAVLEEVLLGGECARGKRVRRPWDFVELVFRDLAAEAEGRRRHHDRSRDMVYRGGLSEQPSARQKSGKRAQHDRDSQNGEVT